MSSTSPAHKKKVLFFITKSNWGGAQRYVYDLASALDRQVYEPVVVLGGNGTLVEMLHNMHIRTITLTSLNRDIRLQNELHVLRELWHILKTEKPDVFHVNSSKAGAIGSILGRLARVPRVIFTAHGWAFNEDRPLYQRLLIKAIHYGTVMAAHHTIAVSRAIVAEMNWPGAAAKMSVINPGRTIGVMFDKDEARKKIEDFFPRLVPYHTDPWIITVAELHPIKRHEVLFAAVRSLTSIYPNIRLVCFGEGALRPKLEAWVVNHGMSEHIFICGNLHEAARFLKAADIFALASKSESYGYVLHEAGLSGLPVVATDVGGIRDIIENDKTGLLVTPDSVTELAGALALYLSNSEIAREHANLLKQTLEERGVVNMSYTTETLYKIYPVS
jgi:glycosyltransferase involved in cell wall biosynthesis